MSLHKYTSHTNCNSCTRQYRYEFALTAEFQNKAKDVKSFQVMSNKSAISSPKAPDLAKIKLIDYDFVKYGSAAERRRLLKKWDDEIGALPR